MNVLAILLDGGAWGQKLPPLPIGWGAYLAPIVTFVCCRIVARNPRHVGYALAVASVFALSLSVPQAITVVNTYSNSYRIEDVSLFFFELGFPFVATAVFHFFPVHKSARRSESASAKSENSALTYRMS